MDAVQIPLGGTRYPGLCATVDAEDLPTVAGYSWHPAVSDGKAYARTTIYLPDGRFQTYRMHRLIVNAAPGELVDHKNGDGLDNRRSNIRKATARQNAANSRIPNRNTSGYKGVHLRKDNGKYSASIRQDDRMIKLGCFATAREAALAYDHRARILFGEFARLNFPDVVLAAPPEKSVKAFGASGYRGVYWLPRQRKWRVAISRGGDFRTYGLFTALDMAIACARSHGSGQACPMPSLITEGHDDDPA